MWPSRARAASSAPSRTCAPRGGARRWRSRRPDLASGVATGERRARVRESEHRHPCRNRERAVGGEDQRVAERNRQTHAGCARVAGAAGRTVGGVGAVDTGLRPGRTAGARGRARLARRAGLVEHAWPATQATTRTALPRAGHTSALLAPASRAPPTLRPSRAAARRHRGTSRPPRAARAARSPAPAVRSPAPRRPGSSGRCPPPPTALAQAASRLRPPAPSHSRAPSSEAAPARRTNRTRPGRGT